MNNKVLVIDDDTAVAEMLKDSLEFKGYKVRTANSGKEGLLKASQFMPQIITLDLSMPDMSGFEVLERLKRSSRTKDIIVFILTVMDEKQSLQKGFMLGAKEYIIKPCAFKNLESLIENTLKN